MAGNILDKFFVLLGLQFDKNSANQAKNSAMSAGGVIKGALAGLTVGKLVSEFSQLTKELDAIQSSAQGMGVSTKQFQELQYVAKQSNVEMGSISMAISKVSAKLTEAASGSKEAKEFFGAMGLSVSDLLNLSPDERFEKLGTAIGSIKNPALRTGTAVKLFGKSAQQLLPMFADGSKGLEELKKDFNELGGGFSEDLIDRAAQFDFQMNRLSVVMNTRVKSAFLNLLLPITNLVTRFNDFTKTDKFVTFQKVAANALEVVGMGLIAFGIRSALANLPLILSIAGIIAAFGLLVLAWSEVKTAIEGGETFMGDYTNWLDDVANKAERAGGAVKFLGDVLKGATSGLGIGLAEALEAYNDPNLSLAQVRRGETTGVAKEHTTAGMAEARAKILEKEGVDMITVPVTINYTGTGNKSDVKKFADEADTQLKRRFHQAKQATGRR